MRELIWMAALASAACKHPHVIAFTVDPPLACPGQSVAVDWEVEGGAQLGTRTGSAAEVKESVPSKGHRAVTVAETTAFTIVATDANPAKGDPWTGTKTVDVPIAVEPKRATTHCEASGACSGSFTLTAPRTGMRVVKLSAPMLTQSGATHDARVCVTHDSLHDTCLDPGGTLAVDVPVAGDWSVSTTLPPDATTPPPALSITVQFSCP